LPSGGGVALTFAVSCFAFEPPADCPRSFELDEESLDDEPLDDDPPPPIGLPFTCRSPLHPTAFALSATTRHVHTHDFFMATTLHEPSTTSPRGRIGQMAYTSDNRISVTITH